MRTNFKGFLALFGTSVIYGIFGVIVRNLEPYLTGNQMTAARAIIVALIVGLFLVIKNKKSLIVERKYWLPLFVHSITFGATIFLFTYAVLITTLTKSVFSFYSTTLIMSLVVGMIFFKEKFTTRKKISFFLAVAGLIFFIFPTGIATIDLGMIMTGIAGICDVITNSMKKFLGGKVDNLVLVFYQMLTGVILGLGLIFYSGEFTMAQQLDLPGTLWLLFFALNFFLLSYLTAYGFQHFDLNLGTIILSLEFVWASIAGTLLYGEEITIYQIAASVLLVICIVIMNLPDKELDKA